MAIFEYVDKEGDLCFGIRVVRKDPLRGRLQKEKRLGPISRREAKAEEKRFREQVKRDLICKFELGPRWEDVLDSFYLAIQNGSTQILSANETSLRDYERSLRRHTAEWLNRPALSIAPLDVEILFAELDRKGLSFSRKKHVRTAVTMVYEWAAKQRLLPPTVSSPAKGISIGKREKRRKPILTLNQIRKFLDEAKRIKHEFYELWAVAFLTGMRSGELYALRWTDVCFERNVIRVERSYNKRRDSEKSTKSGDWREIPINGDLLSLLETLRIRTGATGYVLPRLNVWRRGEAAKVTRSFCQAVNVPEINFHATRACFAVQMLQAQVPVPVIMKIGGWSRYESFQHYLRLAGVEIQNATDGLKLMPFEASSSKLLQLPIMG